MCFPAVYFRVFSIFYVWTLHYDLSSNDTLLTLHGKTKRHVYIALRLCLGFRCDGSKERDGSSCLSETTSNNAGTKMDDSLNMFLER